jgi:inner membrane protein
VNFYVPVDYYDLVNRAAKYGIMFLAVAFMAVFVLELTSGRRVHPVQYVMVGLAMILFYALLLSLAEHIGFPQAYLIASAATGGMLSLYVGYALSSAVKGVIMLCVFLILYGLLYLILRLEDYALLAGAVAGFIMLTVTMFATLRVNWSGEEGRQPAG